MLVFQESNQQLSFLLIAHEGPIFLKLVFPFRQSDSEFKGVLKILLAPQRCYPSFHLALILFNIPHVDAEILYWILYCDIYKPNSKQ
jgi:hypothetical protein